MLEFTPWTIDGDRVILGSGWDEPKRWAREAKYLVKCAGCGRIEHIPDGMEETFCKHCGDPAGDSVRPRVLVTTDFAAPCDGTVMDSSGNRLYKSAASSHGEYSVTPHSWTGPARVPVTLADLRADLFPLIDETQIDWWLTTQHQERIREVWPCPKCKGSGLVDTWTRCLCENGCDAEYMRRENVTLAALVRTQADADRLLPELLKCSDLAEVAVVVEPRERIDLTHKYDTGKSEGLTNQAICDLSRVLIRGAIDGPTNLEDIRDLKRQCEEAGVPCEVEGQP